MMCRVLVDTRRCEFTQMIGAANGPTYCFLKDKSTASPQGHISNSRKHNLNWHCCLSLKGAGLYCGHESIRVNFIDNT